MRRFPRHSSFSSSWSRYSLRVFSGHRHASTVVNIPVTDAPSPTPGKKRDLDANSAASIIQSHFRGCRIRHHKPLLHLRTIADVSRQLDSLHEKIYSDPAFLGEIRTDQKKLVELNEKIMALILQLDTIEGVISEVRQRRRDAIRKAIQLQEAIDSIMGNGLLMVKPFFLEC